MTRKSCHFIHLSPPFASSSCRPFLSGCSQGLAWCRSWTAALRSRREGIQRVLGVQICQRWEETKEVTEVTGRSTHRHPTPESPEWNSPGKIHDKILSTLMKILQVFSAKQGCKTWKNRPKLSGRVWKNNFLRLFVSFFFFFVKDQICERGRIEWVWNSSIFLWIPGFGLMILMGSWRLPMIHPHHRRTFSEVLRAILIWWSRIADLESSSQRVKNPWQICVFPPFSKGNPKKTSNKMCSL